MSRAQAGSVEKRNRLLQQDAALRGNLPLCAVLQAGRGVSKAQDRRPLPLAWGSIVNKPHLRVSLLNDTMEKS